MLSGSRWARYVHGKSCLSRASLFWASLQGLLIWQSHIGFPVCSAIQRSPVTCGICAKKVITGDTITADIIKLADLEPDELLYWSHDNRALSHLPYMIILDK